MKVGYFVDWVEVYCLESANVNCLDMLQRLKYRVEIMPYTTRVYGQVVEILAENGEPVGTLCRQPLSVKGDGTNGLLKAGSCHFKIHNRNCYQDNVGLYVMKFCKSIGLRIQSISRVDFCADFQYFQNGMHPSTLIKGFAAEKYLKVKQPRFSLHGTTDKGYNCYNSVLFGSKNSNIYTRFYCKTQEMQDVGMKMWIVDCWKTLGFDMSKQVWRVEFAVKAPGRRCFDRDTAEISEVTIEQLCSRTYIKRWFLSLSKTYFVFKKAENGKRKYDCESLVLFDYKESESEYHPLPTTHTGITRRIDKMVYNYLREETKKSCEHSVQERLDMAKVAGRILWKKRLHEWENWKYGSGIEVRPIGEPVINPSNAGANESMESEQSLEPNQKELWQN